MAGARRWNRLAMLFGIEDTYGTDIVPTVADAIIGANVSFTPIEGEEVSRDLMLPYLGNQGMVLAGQYARLEFDVEIAGAGTAGTVPKYGSLLLTAGMAETVTAGTKVEYTIVEDDVESGSLYFQHDGVQHILLGCQANVALSFAPSAIPKFRITLLGLLGTITDLALMPTVSTAGWTTPLHVSKANTVLSLHGWNAVAESVSLDLGNTLTPRMLIGDELIMISDRKSTGSAVVEARKLATINWFERIQNRTRGLASIIHGRTAGNIVEVPCPAVELGKPSTGQTNGIINYTFPLIVCPQAGRDELKIIVR